VVVPVPEGVRGRDVALEVHPKRLRLAVRGEPVLVGSLVDAGEVRVDGEKRPPGCRTCPRGRGFVRDWEGPLGMGSGAQGLSEAWWGLRLAGLGVWLGR
jgi:hypothetical protein